MGIGPIWDLVQIWQLRGALRGALSDSGGWGQEVRSFFIHFSFS